MPFISSTASRYDRGAPTLLIVGAVAALLLITIVAGPIWALAAVAALSTAAVGAIRPDILALGLMAWLPVETTLLKYLPVGAPALVLPDYCSAVVLVTVLARAAVSREERPWRAARLVLWTAGLLLGGAFLSWLRWRTPSIDAAYWIRTWMRFAPLGLMAAISPWRQLVARRLPLLLVPVVAIQVAVALAEYWGGRSVAEHLWPGTFSFAGVSSARDTLEAAAQGGRYVAGTLGHYNVFALFLVLSLGVFFASSSNDGIVALRIPSRWRVPLRFATLAAAVGVILSASRQGVVSMILVGAAALVITRGRLQLTNAGGGLLIAAVLMLLAATGAVTFWQTASERFAALLSSEFWDVFRLSRGYGVRLAIDALWQSSLVGFGPGSFGLSFASAAGTPQAVALLGADQEMSYYITDVGWASLAAQVGLLGIAALTFSVVTLATALPHRLIREHERIIASTLIVFLTTGMIASTPLTYKPTGLLFWMLLGLVSPGVSDRRLRSRANYHQPSLGQPWP